MSISIKSSSPRQSSLDGKFAWEQGTGKLKTSTTSIAVTPTAEGGSASDIVKAIEGLPDGGGTIYLRNGTYLLESDIVIPDYVTLQGESGDGVIIDFQSQGYQIKVEGTNPYSTGTIAVDNNDVTVTGTDTAWTVDMIGQSIIISGIFFVITDVASATSLTIEAPFDSPSVAGVDYVIADPSVGVLVKDLTIQNSTHAMGAILYRYIAGADQEGVTVFDSTIGFNYLDSSFVTGEDITAIGCGVGINLDHAGVWTFTDFSCYSCDDNIIFNRFISSSINNATSSSSIGNGITITNSSNLGIYDMTITTNGANGIELSDSHDTQISSMVLEDNAGDGLKLTANVDRVVMNSLALVTNGGFGINIVDSASDDNVISSSVFDGNVSGEYDDNGTGTVIILGGGAGAVDSVNGQTGVVVLDQDDVGDGATYKQYSGTEKTKLAGIETAADVTDAANVAAAGAVMDTGNETVAGIKTFSSDPLIPDEAYDATAWNGSLEPPTKNAVRDKIETIAGGGTGDVVGPASVTDDNPAVFDGTTGKLIKQKTYAAFKTLLALVKGDVGLGNVDNTSDATKDAAVTTLTNKTLTAPKFADLGFIADANGNELIILDTVTSAVNEITLANAATGSDPILTASGGDSAIGIVFQLKTSGAIHVKNTGSSTSSKIRLYERADFGSNYAQISAPAGAMSADRNLTLPDADDTLVGKATTDTLTNKTIVGANNTVSGITPAMRTGGFYAVLHAFANATGSQSITGVGFAPKGLIVIGHDEASTSTLPIANGYAYNTGAGTVQGGKFGVMSESGPAAGSISSNSNCFVRSDASGTGTFIANVTSWDADGITVNVGTTSATASHRTYHVMFFG